MTNVLNVFISVTNMLNTESLLNTAKQVTSHHEMVKPFSSG